MVPDSQGTQDVDGREGSSAKAPHSKPDADRAHPVPGRPASRELNARQIQAISMYIANPKNGARTTRRSCSCPRTSRSMSPNASAETGTTRDKKGHDENRAGRYRERKGEMSVPSERWAALRKAYQEVLRQEQAAELRARAPEIVEMFRCLDARERVERFRFSPSLERKADLLRYIERFDLGLQQDEDRREQDPGSDLE